MPTKRYFSTGLSLAALLSFSSLALSGAKDDPLLVMGKLDQFEVRSTEGEDPLVLEGQAWLGYDLNKLWLKADVEREDDESEGVEIQALYSHAISAFWDVQAGLRKDFIPTPDRTWGVIGIQGLAPYKFEVDAALFVGESGRSAARFEAEYELLFTQRLILTPEIEVNAYGQNDVDTGNGSGLADVELGLRLRYEVRREIAPYVGVNWEKKYGNTADFTELQGGEVEDTQFVVGVRAWF
ncbi:MAG TPA: copper resistance protein CopB [Spongiibacteraceae bacterium]|nr:copper resistance protein CopB [Spongiibacteraceae bacterium]